MTVLLENLERKKREEKAQREWQEAEKERKKGKYRGKPITDSAI